MADEEGRTQALLSESLTGEIGRGLGGGGGEKMKYK